MQTETHPSDQQVTSSRRLPLLLAGTVAAGVALAAGELAAGLVVLLPSLVSGVATFVIDTVPTPIKDLAIDLFGVYDKLALGIGIVVVSLLLGGWISRRSGGSFGVMAAVFSLFGLAGALAAARTPQVTWGPAVVNGGISALAGLAAHRVLLGAAPAAEDEGRRKFLAAAGAMAGLAVIAAYGGREMIERTRRMIAGRSEITLPPPGDPVPPPPAAASLDVSGLSPVVTPNPDFYRIDTVPFDVPRVDVSTWQVTVKGLVDREVSFSFPDLLDLGLVERYITLACVSNRVGGDLVDNAKWLGVPLRELLDRAGVRPEAEQVVGRSVDGFTVGFPVDAVYDGRDAMVAVGMNDEPLPFEHGFPARLVVAGLYGYVSATKWLSEIELTTWEGFDAYWVPRGWAKEAPIKTQSRIDTPADGARIEAGRRAIAGVAWAPTRGISRVEVRIDEGEWREADLSESLSDDAWRQWVLEWDATEGSHVIEVRATDGTGETQTGELSPPAPDGATGWHSVRVSVA